MKSRPSRSSLAPPGTAQIVSHPIDPRDLEAVAHDLGAGAVVQFVGRVRDRTADAEVVELHYEFYAGMAEAVLADIVGEAAGTWPLIGVSVVHRVGTLLPGEVSVCVTVSAAHRDPAFAACRYIIDTLKHRAPIWKRETLRSGERRWIEEEMPRGPTDRSSR